MQRGKLEMEVKGQLIGEQHDVGSDNRNPPAVRSQLFVQELNWDFNFIDKLLYLLCPIAFLGVALLILVSALTEKPSVGPSISCWCPDEFKQSMVSYTHSICLNGNRSLYLLPSGPNTIESLDNLTEFETENYRDYSDLGVKMLPADSLNVQVYLVMTVGCLIPFVMWRVFGRIDGAGVVRISRKGETNPCCAVISPTIMWFAVCKIAAIVLLGYMLSIVKTFNYQIMQINSMYKTSEVESSGPVGVLCNFQVKSAVGNTMHYTVQCLFDGGEAGGPSPMLQILQRFSATVAMFVTGVLIAHVINLLTILAVLLLSLIESYRDSIVSRFVGDADGLTADHATVFVCIMAARNGQSLQVQHLLYDAAKKLK